MKATNLVLSILLVFSPGALWAVVLTYIEIFYRQCQRGWGIVSPEPTGKGFDVDRQKQSPLARWAGHQPNRQQQYWDSETPLKNSPTIRGGGGGPVTYNENHYPGPLPFEKSKNTQVTSIFIDICKDADSRLIYLKSK